MITQSSDAMPVAFSVTIYRLLLAAYPQDFREEYGDDMLQVFRDQTLRAYRQNGMFRLWATTLLDWVQSLFEEHLQKETNMSKSTFIRISGWSLVLGAIALSMLYLSAYLDENYPLLHWEDNYGYISYISGLVVAPFLTAIGLFGLRARYGETLGNSGRTLLLLGTLIGLGLTVVGIVGEVFGLFGSFSDTSWNLLLSGVNVIIFCLALFGFMALRSRPLPRWNGLPILAGIIFPAMVFANVVLNFSFRFSALMDITLIIQLVSMIALGVILQGDVPEQEASMAGA